MEKIKFTEGEEDLFRKIPGAIRALSGNKDYENDQKPKKINIDYSKISEGEEDYWRRIPGAVRTLCSRTPDIKTYQ